MTHARHGHALEVWGCVRPARFAILDTGQPQVAEIQFQGGSRGVFKTIRTETLTSPGTSCYFDAHIAFPSTGSVRLAWIYPTLDLLLGYIDPLRPLTAYSRSIPVTVN